MTSDLLPHLGELADDICFIHSMTAKTNTHGPAENQMGTGFTLDGFPEHGRVGDATRWAARTQDLPAFVAIPDPRGVPQTGPNHWGAGFLPAVFQGTPFNADKPIPNLAPPGEHLTPAPTPPRATSSSCSTTSTSSSNPGDSDLAARIASYELAARMQLSAAEVSDLVERAGRTPRDVRRRRRQHAQGRLRPQLPARPPAARARRAVRAALQRRLRHGRRRRQLGRPQDHQRPVRRPRPDPRPARRRPASRT